MKANFFRVIGGILTLFILLAATVCLLNYRGEQSLPDRDASFFPSADQVERGKYLALAGDCMACHTRRGGAQYAGGRAVPTPFGMVYSSNLTPDQQTGLGSWTPDLFWRALHNGRSKDGRFLYPAFPYPSFTNVTREDSDAIFAYLRTLPPVLLQNRPHELRFPYDRQFALAVWRALFFSPGTYVKNPTQSEPWNRGAYLVHGLGHCIACHSPHNVFGGTSEDEELSGGLIPAQNWYAPSLMSSAEAGVANWRSEDVIDLLKNGVSQRGSVIGPMAEVVYQSTQYLTRADLGSIAVFLRDLPQEKPNPPRDDLIRDPTQMKLGGKIYNEQCSSCHGESGEGAVGAYPALSGNRTVTLDSPVNLVRIVRSGGFLPSTSGNPRPFGMPPLGHVLSDVDVAAVLTYIRGSWGNNAGPVTQIEVLTYQTGTRK